MPKTSSEKQPLNSGAYDPVSLETEVSERWNTEKTFKKSIEQRRNSKPFTFLTYPIILISTLLFGFLYSVFLSLFIKTKKQL
mgnify:CR=1 FL=1